MSMSAEIEVAEHQELELDELNAIFEVAEPQKIVAWAVSRFGDDLLMTSSFGADSATLLHMATRVMPSLRVVMVDTGYLFEETLEHVESLRRRLDLNLLIYRTKNDPAAYLAGAGETDPRYRNHRDACCAANKNEPMNRAMAELAPAAWLRGIRRSQTQHRKNARFVEWAGRYNCYAISPLLNWGTREIYAYMKKHDLPHHPLYEQGYASIGCNPLSCTRPIAIGEDPRAGRWSGTDKAECGINLTDSLDSAQL